MIPLSLLLPVLALRSSAALEMKLDRRSPQHEIVVSKEKFHLAHFDAAVAQVWHEMERDRDAVHSCPACL